MSWIEAIILGLIQGLTEFLPVSSSGHLTIAGTLFGMKSGEEILAFTTLLHVATVCSIIVVLRNEIKDLFKGFFAFRRNRETETVLKLLLSAIPVAIIGLFFKDKVEAIFGQGLFIVGCMLLLTGALLTISYMAKPKQTRELSFRDAFIIGIAQACAVMPGLSRSGSTIATGIMLGNRKEEIAKFSFLMVVIPVLGEAFLDVLKIMKGDDVLAYGSISPVAMIAGFAMAFVSGAMACKWMIGIVRRGKLIYFAYYCCVIGIASIVYSLL